MRIVVCAVLGLALLGAALPVMAGDIVAMPTANTVAPRNVELNAIFWNTEGGNTNIFEAFIGVVDRLELDVLYVDLPSSSYPDTASASNDSVTELNLYYTLVKETADNPSLVLGATNILESDWLGGEDQASPFVVSAFNIAVPEGKPSLNDPMLRLHAGWGNGFHKLGNRSNAPFFGGVQGFLHPNLGFAVLNYQGQMNYMGTILAGGKKQFELTYGIKNADTFLRAGYKFGW